MIGLKITQLRKNKGVTQKEMAKSLGISRSALSLYELNKREPDLDTIRKISDYLSVSTDYLIGNTNDSQKNGNFFFFFFDNEHPNRLEMLLKNSNLTISELALEINVPYEDIEKIFRERQTRLETIIKIADYFNVSLDYLLGRSNNNKYLESKSFEDKERNLLETFQEYQYKGFTKKIAQQLFETFPEISSNFQNLTYAEDKILTTFKKLSEDNKDIIIGEMKKLIKEQNYYSVAAEENEKLRPAK